jgi:hypothetical protein
MAKYVDHHKGPKMSRFHTAKEERAHMTALSAERFDYIDERGKLSHVYVNEKTHPTMMRKFARYCC